MKRLYFFSAIISVAVIAACGGSKQDDTASKEAQENQRYDLELKEKLGLFSSLPKTARLAINNDEQVKLGHALYFDNRLSKNNTISCNSCHNLATFGVDNLPTSPGDAGENGDRNSPTVLNAALHNMQFWDGRAKDVEEQAGMPVLNPVEMAIPSEKFLVDRLSQIDMYKTMFAAAYPNDKNPITYTNLRNAIGAFERELITPSRFDDYLNGKTDALSLQEKKGLMSFVNIGCTQCHSGALLGGNSLQKFGVHANYAEYTKSEKVDEGRFNVTKDELDKFMFKTPSLRNIAKTGPYFHDGSVRDLKKAIEIMALVQLKYDISNSEIENIAAFLESLTGDFPDQYKKAPQELVN
jgi:cytochrome c peroxidase